MVNGTPVAYHLPANRSIDILRERGYRHGPARSLVFKLADGGDRFRRGYGGVEERAADVMPPRYKGVAKLKCQRRRCTHGSGCLNSSA